MKIFNIENGIFQSESELKYINVNTNQCAMNGWPYLNLVYALVSLSRLFLYCKKKNIVFVYRIILFNFLYMDMDKLQKSFYSALRIELLNQWFLMTYYIYIHIEYKCDKILGIKLQLFNIIYV